MRRTLTTIGILIAVVLLVGPVQLSYATGDSMEPTISDGDAYLVTTVHGEISPGDIIVFHRMGGETVVHRVTEVTTDGYITRGDNNPSTDQQAGWEQIDSGQVKGKVVTIGGTPLAVGGIGDILQFIDDNRYVSLGVALAVLTSLHLLFKSSDDRSRIHRIRDEARTIGVVLFILGTIAVLVGGNSLPAVFVHSTVAPPASDTVETGDPGERTYVVSIQRSPVSTLVITATGDITIEEVDRTGADTWEVTVSTPPHDDPGVSHGTIDVYAYPRFLPTDILTRLQMIHPTIAATASVAFIAIPVFVSYLLLIDPWKVFRRDYSIKL